MKTLIDVISDIFVYGTNGNKSYEDEFKFEHIKAAPKWPPDLFAICAYILNAYDTYARLNALSENSFRIEAKERQHLVVIGTQWRELEANSIRERESKVQALWTFLLDGAKKIDMVNCDGDELLGSISLAAMKLLIIADEACSGIGIGTEGELSWIQVLYTHICWGKKPNKDLLTELLPNWHLPKKIADKLDECPGLSDIELLNKTLCIQIPESILATQPKRMVAQVGSTLRSLSQNICLLPSNQKVQVEWNIIPKSASSRESNLLNILAVPLPYMISADSFSSFYIKDCSPHRKVGMFRVNSNWCEQDNFDLDLQRMLGNLLRKANSELDGGSVDIVVFPELALSEKTFYSLCRYLSEEKEFKDISVIISGTNAVAEEPRSNRTHGLNRSSTYFLPEKIEQEGADYFLKSFQQEKHHRWKLDAPQITRYSLRNVLDGEAEWWENIPINKRNIKFFAPSRDLCFTTLICEDLARIDPCQQIIRSVGPNIVFALLMDGPQLKGRWSERYSMGLSDDPGCSVFSLTSLGLVKRSNLNLNTNKNIVGVWRDSDTGSHEIKLPRQHHAVLLTLLGKEVNQMTLDGRSHENRKVWTYAGYSSLRDDESSFNV